MSYLGPSSMPMYPYSPYYGMPEIEQEKPNYIGGFLVFCVLCWIGYQAYLSYISPKPDSKTNAITFNLGESKETTLNEIGDSQSQFLDRHKIECPKKTSINKFKYELGDQTKNETKDKFQYKYTCTKDGDLEDTLIPKTTPENDRGGGDFVYLDRHNIECGKDEVLNSFKYERQGADKIYYSYNCIKSKKPLTCRQVKTDLSISVDADNTKNLKNLNPSCLNNEALQSFKFIRGENNTKIGYDYKCCKYD